MFGGAGMFGAAGAIQAVFNWALGGGLPGMLGLPGGCGYYSTRPKSKCCVVSTDYPIPPTPKAVIGKTDFPLAFGAVSFKAHFKMKAEFQEGGAVDFGTLETPRVCRCRCCEYRQEIRGFFKINDVDQKINGRVLHQDDWREDRTQAEPAGRAYGHRLEGANIPADQYIAPPNREEGCKYEGSDSPGVDPIVVTAKTIIEGNLEFKGYIIDVCREGYTIDEKLWDISFTYPPKKK